VEIFQLFDLFCTTDVRIVVWVSGINHKQVSLFEILHKMCEFSRTSSDLLPMNSFWKLLKQSNHPELSKEIVQRIISQKEK